MRRRLATMSLGWLAVGMTACGHATSTPRPPPPAPAAVRAGPAGFTLSTAPSGLLRPGGERLIQERLVANGQLPRDRVTGHLDDTTQAALLRFQGTHGLARTGLPGYETIERLGLSPSQVFRAVPTPKRSKTPSCNAASADVANDREPGRSR